LRLISTGSGGQIGVGGGTSAIKFSSTGKVGIGNQDPGYKLHVSDGDTLLSYYGPNETWPNETWSSYLLTGSGTNKIGTRQDIAQVVSTNGKLHTDAGQDRYIYLNYYAGNGVDFSDGGNSARSVFTGTGRLGNNTISPGVPLSVQTSSGDILVGTSYRHYSYDGFLGTTQSTTKSFRDIIIRATEAIQCERLLVGSDERIKKDIMIDVEDDEALQILRQLQLVLARVAPNPTPPQRSSCRFRWAIYFLRVVWQSLIRSAR